LRAMILLKELVRYVQIRQRLPDSPPVVVPLAVWVDKVTIGKVGS
jgi:hypothetical protein